MSVCECVRERERERETERVRVCVEVCACLYVRVEGRTFSLVLVCHDCWSSSCIMHPDVRAQGGCKGQQNRKARDVVF